MMKVLAFAASSSKQSINAQLVRYAGSLIRDADVEYLDINDYEMPLFSVDRLKEMGMPEAAKRFYNRIGQADALLISFAEHNGSFTAAYKSLYDWTSQISAKVFQEKPVVMLSTSPGGRGGASVLETAVTTGGHFGAKVMASMSVPKFYDNFDTDAGIISNPDINAELTIALASLFEIKDPKHSEIA